MKMFIIMTGYQENDIQTIIKHQLMRENELIKRPESTNIGKYLEKKELWYAADGNVN